MWLLVSSFIVKAYKSMGFSARIQAPITQVWLDVAGVLYVYDIDLFLMHECLRSGLDIFHKSQDALTSWGRLLIETGGALKPEKWFYYMVDYEWLADGSWKDTEIVDRDMFVPCVNGSEVEIEQLPVDKSRKTLGIWTNPAGDCSCQLEPGARWTWVVWRHSWLCARI